MAVYLDGRFVDRARATVSVDDRGFLFGDGVYEVTRAYNGRLFEWERHVRRLTRGLAGLSLALPDKLDGAGLNVISERLLRENGLETGHATVYFQITRGVAVRKHQFPPPGTPPTVFLSAARLVVPDQLREQGAPAVTTADLRWARCDLKTINLLPNVLAKQQAAAAGAFEAILIRDGIVTEGASSNVFAVIGGKLRTHPLANRILAGVTREVVLELAAELNVTVVEEPFVAAELWRASEVIVTATTADVMPVVSVDGRPVGDGRVGPVARRLGAAFRARLEREPANAPAV
jgi:D-alanine transaminase